MMKAMKEMFLNKGMGHWCRHIPRQIVELSPNGREEISGGVKIRHIGHRPRGQGRGRCGADSDFGWEGVIERRPPPLCMWDRTYNESLPRTSRCKAGASRVLAAAYQLVHLVPPLLQSPHFNDLPINRITEFFWH